MITFEGHNPITVWAGVGFTALTAVSQQGGELPELGSAERHAGERLRQRKMRLLLHSGAEIYGLRPSVGVFCKLRSLLPGRRDAMMMLIRERCNTLFLR